MRTRLLLLMLFVSLVSLNAGVLAARYRAEEGHPSWPWMAVLVAYLLAALWLHYVLLRPFERDLQRRRDTEDDVRRHAHEFQELYNRAPCGYHSLDAGGRFVRVNDTALAWLGYQRDEVLGHPFADFLTPAARPAFAERFEEFKRTGLVRDAEFQLVKKDGTLLHVLLSAVAHRDEAGRFVVSRSTFIDVTQRKLSEQRSHELALRLRAVLDAATSVAVVATDLDGRITLFNAGAERLLGYAADEMLGRESPWAIHQASEVLAQGERLSRETGRPLRGFDVLVDRARRGEPDRREWTYVCKDGGTLTVDLVVTALRAEDRTTGFLFVAADVSERVAAAQALRMTMEAARIGTWDWDLLADRCVWSDNVLGQPDLAATSREQFLGLIEPEDQPRVRSALDAALTKDVFATEFRVTDESGRVRWIEAKGRVFRSDDGRPRQMRGTAMDVTQRWATAAALREAQEAAESANQAKTSSPASLSHETPGQTAAGPDALDAPPLRVLLVEDNPVNQEVLTLMLERAGHRVRVANNGREALLVLDAEAFDVVFMDLQMPEMDGLRCTRLIRQREKATGKRVPIVAITANALSGERQRCLQAGMDDYLSKPVRNHELASVVTRLVGRPGEAEDGEGLAWLRSLREMGFDDDGIARLTHTFLDTVPGRMDALRKAVAARDCDEVQRTAHVLKGSLSVFSARAAMDATVRLMLLSQQQQPDGFVAALAELEAEVGPLLESMGRA